MNDSWTCLAVEKGPGVLSDAVRTALTDAACRLYANKADVMRIEDNLISGVIETEWKTCLVGTRSGIVFRAQLDCETGNDYRVNFLFGEEDLKAGAEVLDHEDAQYVTKRRKGFHNSSVPELNNFSEVRGPSRRTH